MRFPIAKGITFSSVLVCLCVVVVGEVPIEDFRPVAVRFLEEMRLDFKEWQDARVAPTGFPLYRPDIRDVAYYEFPVIREQGDKVGYIIVSTGSHDHRIPQWSTKGRTNVERLQDGALEKKANISRYYRVDVATFAAEDAQGNLLAQLGDRDRRLKPTEWRGFKQSFPRTYAEKLGALRGRAAPQWQPRPRSFGIDCGPWRTRYAGNWSDQRWYDQIPSGTSPNTSGCSSGCGATAWAMLFGWADYRASLGDPVWSYSYNLFAPGGHGVAEVAPPGMDANVRNMTWEIRNYIDTSCVGDQGLTWPWNMEQAGEYLYGRDSSALGVDTHFSPVSGENDRAFSSIRNGTPVVILMDFGACQRV